VSRIASISPAEAHERHLARRAFAGIDNVDAFPGDHENTRAGSRGIGKRGTRAAPIRHGGRRARFATRLAFWNARSAFRLKRIIPNCR